MDSKNDKIHHVWRESSASKHNLLKNQKDFEDHIKITSSNMSFEESIENIHANVPKMFRKQICQHPSRNARKSKVSNVIITYLYNPSTIPKYFWYLISITSIITADLNLDIGGTDLELTTLDILGMIITTYLLLLSFHKVKPLLALPWMVTFIWSLYTCQYLSLVQMIRTNAYIETNLNTYLWVAYGLAIFSLGLRFVLWCKVLDFLFGTNLLRFISYWVEIVGYMSKRITTVRTIIPKQN